MDGYIERSIDKYLLEWKEDASRKPLLLRGARQVGKSWAVKHLGQTFRHFAEVNFERQKAVKSFFQGDIDARLIAAKIGSYIGVPVGLPNFFLSVTRVTDRQSRILPTSLVKQQGRFLV